MYTEGAQTTGHHRFHQKHINNTTPCSCQHCVHYDQPAFGQHGGPAYQPAPERQTDHPSLDCMRDVQAPRVKDVGGRAILVDRAERSGHRSPQRRPVFGGPGPYSQSHDFSQVCPWELNPAQWSYPPEPGVRHYPSVREQCGCVMRCDTRAHPFNAGIPHPLPHLQVKGPGYRHRRTVRYVCVDEEEESCGCKSENYHSEPQNPHLGHLNKPNGHCGQRAVFSEGGEERDSHQDRGRLKGGSEEGWYGRGGSHKGFFPTEVPQKQLNQSRQKGPCVPPSGVTVPSPEPSKPTTNDHQRQGSEVVTQKRRQDSVRDQIRQVVTNLEDVLGGLKQVHVEMKEVVEQIDRLTASIDLSDEAPCISQGPSSNFSSHHGELRLALLPNHQPAPVPTSQHLEEDRIILRTNSPSPVHTASVVKTSRFTPPIHHKDIINERLGLNGHPPHLYPPRDSHHVGQTHLEPLPHSLDPKVIIGNSTSNSRTQKPPLYPQNGRCGKGPYPYPKTVRPPAYPERGRESTSMV
ncbi:hypothetical protein PBY51_021721 [Eleginops maclovinus]|uniref:Protein Largen n=1 Tax=Eleginops maclovinus TaxID=56733 RepID=A0AAN7XIG2_ELEMC|nr:hypothetical protein PBY51_021721 [Eleginops maclovinus]